MQSGHKLRPKSIELIEAIVSPLEASPDTPRRRWSGAAKERIILEALVSGANISEIARRHDLRPQQVFTWIRQARRTSEAQAAATELVAPAPTAAEDAKNGIEIVFGDAVIFIGDDVPTPRLVEIVRAIRSK